MISLVNWGMVGIERLISKLEYRDCEGGQFWVGLLSRSKTTSGADILNCMYNYIN